MRLAAIWRSIARMALAQGASAAWSLLIVVVTARALGPDGRGAFVAATTWSMLIATVFSLSLGHALMHRMQTAGQLISVSVLVGTLVRAACVLGALGGMCLMLVAHQGWIGGAESLQSSLFMLASMLVPLLLWEQYAVALHGRAGMLDDYARSLLFARALGALLVCGALFVVHASASGAILAVVIGQAVLAALTAERLGRRVGISAWSAKELAAMMPAALKLHITNIAVIAIDAITVLLVFGSLTPADAGVYQLAQQAGSLLLLVPTAASVVLQGRMSTRDADRDWPTHRRIILSVFIVVLAAAALLSSAAPWVIRLLGGDEYEKGGHILQILAWAAIGPTLATLLAPQWIGRGVFALNALLTIVAAFLLLTGTSFAIEISGVEGAALARVLILGGVATGTQLTFMLWVEFRYRSGLEASTIKS